MNAEQSYPDISHESDQESRPEIEAWTQNEETIIVSNIVNDPSEMDTPNSTLRQNVEQNEADLLVHLPEPAAENMRSLREDDEENFSQTIDGQNILKSSTTFKFRCLCQCQPPIESEKFINCYVHMRAHQVEIIIPAERCTRCGAENKSVFKMIHTCAVKPYSRKNRRWRKSGSK